MINMISKQTLAGFQATHGIVKGLEEFLTRHTGNTTGEAFKHIGNLMSGKVKEVFFPLAAPDGELMVKYVREIIELNYLKGFSETRDGNTITFSYFPYSL